MAARPMTERTPLRPEEAKASLPRAPVVVLVPAAARRRNESRWRARLRRLRAATPEWASRRVALGGSCVAGAAVVVLLPPGSRLLVGAAVLLGAALHRDVRARAAALLAAPWGRREDRGSSLYARARRRPVEPADAV